MFYVRHSVGPHSRFLDRNCPSLIAHYARDLWLGGFHIQGHIFSCPLFCCCLPCAYTKSPHQKLVFAYVLCTCDFATGIDLHMQYLGDVPNESHCHLPCAMLPKTFPHPPLSSCRISTFHSSQLFDNEQHAHCLHPSLVASSVSRNDPWICRRMDVLTIQWVPTHAACDKQRPWVQRNRHSLAAD